MKLKEFTTDQLKAKLLAKTDIQESGCWIWTGKNAESHGQTYGQLRLSRTCAVLAHRISFHAFKGPIPKGQYIAHTCGNKGCINPDHLKSSKKKSGGRPRTINEDKAREIIHLWNTRTTTDSLAAQFGVTTRTIYNTINSTTWKHLREPSANQSK